MKNSKSKKIDWVEIINRLSLAQNIAQSSVNQSEILSERAKILAVELDSGARRAGLDLLLFSLAGERYGIDTAFVQEVCKLANLTTVTGAPAHLVGLTNLRGEAIVVYDLTKFLPFPTLGFSQMADLIVIGKDNVEFAVVVDSLDSQYYLALTDILAAPPVEAGSTGYIRGVTKENLIVIDAEALISDQRLYIN